MGASESAHAKTIHEFTAKDSRGKNVDFSMYKGKVILVVNVASKCGFADSNYTQLTEPHEKYKVKGFEILAFPCNQFLRREPVTGREAEEFACTRYQAGYPIFHKVRVFGSRIKWNFTKFLVDKEGQVLSRYGPMEPPLAIEDDVQKALGEV